MRLRDGFLRAGVGAVLLVAGMLGLSASAFAATKTEPGNRAEVGAALAISASAPHVMLIMEENRNRAEVVGAADMPYFNSLASKYVDTTSWEGVGPSSLADYLAVISGSTQGVTENPTGISFPGVPTLGSQLSEVGIAWRAYMADMPTVESEVAESGEYVKRHNPFAYFPGTNGPNVVPGSEFAPDLAEGKLPPFVWYTPNLIDDGHDGTNAEVDRSLESIVPAVQASAWYKEGGIIIITWDESNAPPDVIPTVVVSGEGSGTSFTAKGNHYGTLAAIEDLYGLPLLGNAAHATPLLIPGATGREVTPPTVETQAASLPTQTSATLNATVNPNGSALSACKFEYGTTNSYGQSAPCSSLPGSGTSLVTVSATVPGLTANTNYHFRISATNPDGTSKGSDQTFTTLVNAPAVVTGSASSIKRASATLTAMVNPNAGEVSECRFEYGSTTAYGSSASCSPQPGSGTSPVAVSASVTGLVANTTYHFRISATNPGGTSKGADETVKTLEFTTPTVVSEPAASITQTSTTLTASVNPNEGEVNECKFEYGATTSYGKTASCSSLPGSGGSPVGVSASVTGLLANTAYHFRISATNPGGTSKGADETFKTLEVSAPTVLTVAASLIAQTSATLNATVNPNGAEVSECKFEYGTTTAYGSSSSCTPTPGSEGSPVAVSASVTGLTANTVYHFRISATNALGTSKGSDKSFKTLPSPPTVATEPASSIEESSATLHASVNPNGGEVSECKFEIGTTTAYGSSVSCSSLPGSGESPVAVSASLTPGRLAPNTTYHFRISATNAGGTSNGSDQSFKTLPRHPTVVTEAAASITQTSATLDATVNPEGGEVSECKFEYGATTPYGSSAPCTPSPGSGESPVAVSATVTGLVTNTTYHFRIVATNPGGTSYGADQTLMTPAGQGGVLGSQEQKTPPIANAELASTFLTASSSGTVSVKIICPGGESRCTGMVTLRTLNAVIARVTGHQSKRRKAAILTLAAGSFKVAGGHATTVKLHLSGKGRTLLARTHVLHARATIVAHGPAGATHTTQTIVTIRATKAIHGHKLSSTAPSTGSRSSWTPILAKTRPRPGKRTADSGCRFAPMSESVGLSAVASLCCCKFTPAQVPGDAQLRGAHLLGDRLLMALVSDPLETLALELSELDAVGGVADVEVEHGPDERQTAGLAGEPADHLGTALDLAERSLEQVR